MLSIKRLSKKFGKQSLNEVKPAPLGSTVDHTTPPAAIAFTHFQPPVVIKKVPPSRRIVSPHDPTSSDSSDSESEESALSATSGSPVHSVVRKKHLSTTLKMERVSSAEKRTYRQYKYSTGSSSSASSSDDEIKEAFEGHTHLHFVPVRTSLKESKQESPHSHSVVEPVYSARPLKVVPVGHRKPKYFAQMSGAYSERPRLDFNKMQHSKRLVMVRRPLVLRNSSKVHSYQQRPPSLAVSLDISAHAFQPVLTQT